MYTRYNSEYIKTKCIFKNIPKYSSHNLKTNKNLFKIGGMKKKIIKYKLINGSPK